MASAEIGCCLLGKDVPLWVGLSGVQQELHIVPLPGPSAECPFCISAGGVPQVGDR